ncbi:MAG: toxin co-regulated pilus biosynthesis Q family protein [Colwellia sp.]|nr:toxin co-regulated pilus biosynthesis Q family protein [Colwellia sp.]
MSFWLRNIVLASILIVLAYLLFDNQEALFSMAEQGAEEGSALLASDKSSVQTSEKKPIEKASIKKSGNAAADGLSRFYASINPDMNSKGPKIRNNIVFLPDPSGNLIKILEARKMITRPYRKSWQGNTESRPFRKGHTILQKLTEYANQEGLEIIWWLNRDFVIKDPFRIEENILDTSFQLGRSVAGHFENGIAVFFCYRHRALVFIDEPIDYLTDECSILQSKSGY